jgi:hypothetical protein
MAVMRPVRAVAEISRVVQSSGVALTHL